MENTTQARMAGPAIAGMLLMTALMGVLAMATPASAHNCSGDVKSDCGGCSSGQHSHSWSNPTYGNCSSYCQLTDPLCFIDGSIYYSVPVKVTRLVAGCNGDSDLNYFDAAVLNLDGFGGRAFTMSASPGLNAGVHYFQYDGANCIPLGSTFGDGRSVEGVIPQAANVVMVESVSGTGAFHLEIVNQAPPA